jgi:uncharacterized membrane protein
MFGGLFRFLFKFRPVLFQQGTVAFGASRAMLLAVAAAGVLALVALATYGLVSTAGRRDRVVLVALRLAVLAVLLFCLARPLLVLRAAVPQQNFLGVLLDNSRSMQIADQQGQPRSAFVTQNFGPKGALTAALSKRFVLRDFSFASTVDRVGSAADLHYDGPSTRLAPALDRARDELGGLPLAGLVVVSDGADTTDESFDKTLASLKARSIPVFAVGLGEARFDHDIQVTRVEAPRVALKGTSLVVNVMLSQNGYAGRTVPLTVEDNGRIVASQNVTLPPDGESTTVPMHFTASDAGPRTLTFRVPAQPDEQVTQNNSRQALVEVNDAKEKVLYYEGEPRSEIKFVRMAVEDDPNLQLVTLVRTAENKFWRGGVDSPDELADAFPKTREELFKYKAIILGSVEAGAFTADQQRMLADFVSRRGGGLMMMGGRRAFAEGGWAGTPVAEALPVAIDASGGHGAPYFEHLSIHPTHAGEISPVTQLADTEQASAARWKTLPMLSSVNRIGEAKPGATVLLTGSDDHGGEQIVLATQRYGRGRTMAFPIQDSWVWQMDASIPLEDMTHETLWRRLMRWLVEGVPGQVTVTTREDHVDPGDPIEISAEVLNGEYLGVNDGTVVAHLTAPSGKKIDVPMEWTVEQDGDYRASYVPDEEGLYAVKVDATRANGAKTTDLGSDTTHVDVAPSDGEYFDAGLRETLLKRLADETGGHYFTAADAASLPEAIGYSGRGVTVVEDHDLWDMPAILLVLLGAICAEWAFRRRRGLA